MALYDEYLRKKVNELPDNPGVYQYFDSSGVIIYIGKAKNLKKRVLSYLNKSNQSSKAFSCHYHKNVIKEFIWKRNPTNTSNVHQVHLWTARSVFTAIF